MLNAVQDNCSVAVVQVLDLVIVSYGIERFLDTSLSKKKPFSRF